jgi:pimeloyl-ACP methyl ester carboxylesterase
LTVRPPAWRFTAWPQQAMTEFLRGLHGLSIMTERVQFTNNRGRVLHGRIYRAPGRSLRGVIFSHGLFSSKDGYKVTRFAEAIADAGYDLLAFDFSCAGESGGSIADLSVLQQVEDLKSATEYFLARGIEGIHYVGSSMGAAVSLLYLAGRPSAALSMSGIATPADIRGLITENTTIADPGSLPAHGMTELQGIPIKNAFFREIDRIDMPAAISAVAVPILLIHGGMDAVVKPGNVELIRRHAALEVRSIIVDDGDHNLVRDSDIDIIRTSLVSWFRDSDTGRPAQPTIRKEIS